MRTTVSYIAQLLRSFADRLDPPCAIAECRAQTRAYVRELMHAREADLIDLNACWTPRAEYADTVVALPSGMACRMSEAEQARREAAAEDTPATDRVVVWSNLGSS